MNGARGLLRASFGVPGYVPGRVPGRVHPAKRPHLLFSLLRQSGTVRTIRDPVMP